MLNQMEVAGGGGGGGGCCCAARAFPQAHDLGPSSEVQKILLRFRPIAPRPVPPPPPGSGASTKTPEESLGGSCVGKNGKKRSRAVEKEEGESRRTRLTRTRRGPKPKKKTQASVAEAAGAASSSVTTSATSSEGEVAFVRSERGAAAPGLPLLPEAPAMMKLPPQFATTDLLQVTAGWWEKAPQLAATGTSHIVAPTPHRPVCSVVTVVESLAGEWEIASDEEQQRSCGWLAGCEEQEAKRKLWADARPALVSDPSGKVTWANAAYRRMVGALDDDAKATAAPATDERDGVANGAGVRTLLVAPAAALEKDTLAFSCRVKVRWCGAGRTGSPEKGSITAPCDVWRLAGGSLVWRIDVGAALSLGPIGP